MTMWRPGRGTQPGRRLTRHPSRRVWAGRRS